MPSLLDSSRQIVPIYLKQATVLKFRGTAFFINPTHLLTARHVIDHGDSTQGFVERKERTEWFILYPNEKGKPPAAIRVQRGSPHPEDRDVILLKLEGELPSPPEIVPWLEGITEVEWEDRASAIQSFPVRGFPKTLPIQRSDQLLTVVDQLESIRFPKASPTFTPAGLTRGGLFDAKTTNGNSGGPTFWQTSTASYCFGIASEGGERSTSTTFVGEGAILPWLRQMGVEFRSERLPDIRDARLNPYFDDLVRRTRTLLIPVFGSPSPKEPLGHAVNPFPEIAEFIEVFICLHTHEFGTADRPIVREEAVQFMYEAAARGEERAGRELRPFAEAAGPENDLSTQVLQLAKRAVQHCAKIDIPSLSPLSGWQALQFPMYCRFIHEQVETGDLELVDKTPVWNALNRNRHLVLTGSPGGGKTTVALFLGLALATPLADRTQDKLAAFRSSDGGFSRRVPILVRLRDFKTLPFITTNPKTMEESIETLLDKSVPSAQQPTLARLWQTGRVFLIFDGLDELESDTSRESFCRCLTAWLKDERRQNAVLVTTRPTAYPPADTRSVARQPWDLPGFALWELEPLTPKQQRDFLVNWFRWQPVAGEEPQTTAGRVAQQLTAPSLKKLAQDPLLLVGLARLASQSRPGSSGPVQLPETRSEVLDQVIHLMLTRWEADKHSETHSCLESLLAKLLLRASDLRSLLARLALQSFLPRSAGDFERHTLETKLRELSSRQPGSRAASDPGLVAEVHNLMEELSQHSGLIRPLEWADSNGVSSRLFDFPARPYRNYLAGEALFEAVPKNAPPLAQEAFNQSPTAFAAYCAEHSLATVLGGFNVSTTNLEHADEALQLGMERLAIRVGRRAFLEEFRQQILQRQQQGQAAFLLIRAAASVALEVKEWTPLSQEGPCRLSAPRTWNLAEWREHLRRAMHSPQERLEDRAAAGTLLGLLSPPPDFSRPLPIQWCDVGTDGNLRFLRGDDQPWGGGGEHPCDLVRSPFFMSRFPVTVDDYEAFVRLSGAAQPQQFVTRHDRWHTPVFHTPNHPVVGVSWSEAVTYCQWLTDEMRQGHLQVPPEVTDLANWEIRLPEECEWELAARGGLETEPPRPAGAEALRVPWGWASLEQIRQLANCENRLKWTSPVELFNAPEPDHTNRSPAGVVDLVGNTWEWCRTSWIVEGNGDYPIDYDLQLASPQDSQSLNRVVRGGSWSGAPENCRCAGRDANHPAARYGALGFRPVLAPVPSGASGARVPSRSVPNAVDAGEGRAEGSEGGDA